MMELNAKTMTKTQRSMLVYAECCAVDHSGLLEGKRMNDDDMEALKVLKGAGLLDYGRIPAALLEGSYGRTNWITLTELGWALAHQLRRIRSEQIGPTRQAVNEALAQRETASN